MTATTAELCGYRWADDIPGIATNTHHTCARVPDHQDDPALRRPGTCECRCGATTTREEAQP
jgi:hypothetical protein